MAERLKQIWGGFERVTQRSLTGRGVENIEVPNRRDMQAHDEAFLPQNFSAPADAAFSALKRRLSGAERRAMQRETRRARTEGRALSAPPAPISGDAAEVSAPDSVRDLIRGLHSTEMRTQRREFDYIAFAAANPKAAPKLKSRRKIFGIF